MIKVRQPIDPAFATCLEKYEYTPLDTSRQQLRSAKFRQDQGVTIRCELRIFDFDRCPPYDALSYVWGPPTPLFAIVVDKNRRLETRENLHHCLLQYCEESQRQGHAGYIWIDQISIDQSSMAERNDQVGLMADSYRGSAEVSMWLQGRPDIQNLQIAADEIDGQTWESRHKLFEHVKTIFDNTYFTRLWIVQEVLLARRLHVMIQGYLTSHMSWHYLIQGEARSSGRQEGTRTHAWLTRDHDMSLYKCLFECGHLQCEKAHDQVYGLMGIVTRDQRLQIDYNKTLMEVFLDVLEMVLKHSWDSLKLGFEQRTLSSLAKNMGLQVTHHNALDQVFLEIKNADPIADDWIQAAGSIRPWERHGYLNPSEVIAIGFDKASE